MYVLMWEKARGVLLPQKLTMGSGTRVVPSGVSSESTAEIELRIPKMSHNRESRRHAPIKKIIGLIIAHFITTSQNTLVIEVLLLRFLNVAGRLLVSFWGEDPGVSHTKE